MFVPSDDLLIAIAAGSWQSRVVQDAKLVLFDFDGILVDTEWAIYQAWRNCYQQHEQELPLEIYTRCIGSDFATWSPKTHLEDLTGKTFDWESLDAVRQQEIVAELADEGAMPGARELIEELRRLGMPMGVVSSSSHHWVDGWLDRLGIAGFFDHVVCRGDAPRIKPAPDLWLEAAKRFAVEPGEILVIEDSHNGLISARDAGMRVWAVPNRVTGCLNFEGADRVQGSLWEVVNTLRDGA